MTQPDHAALISDASRRQAQAADPAVSAWVAASAGSGKTKVLTDRVLTLLVTGAAPHRLLCLTFTKAAAAEMSNRVNALLARWTIASDDDLTDRLSSLLGRAPEPGEVLRARRLFAMVLDSPGGMHIETIHAFCQSLLRRFPLEAGLAPHFQVMDDRDAGELLEEAKEEVLIHARRGDDDALAAALAEVTGLIHESAFPELMDELARDRGRLRRFLDRHGGGEAAIAALYDRVGLRPDESTATLLAAACAEDAIDGAPLRRGIDLLAGGNKTERTLAAALAPWLADPAGRIAGFDTYRQAFVAKEGHARANLVSKALGLAQPWLDQAIRAEAERLAAIGEKLRAAQVAQASAALLRLGQALLAAYGRRKAARALMDYDDLILAARALLEQPGQAAWVLYKLDGGIDHVLIDEAQDTNPDQWAVVAALTGEFFAGIGARDRPRTVFAVGDIKQSIYSFQRADPAEFARQRGLLSAKAAAAGMAWREIPLNLSFRSTRAVLDAVDAVFAGTGPGRDGVTDDDPAPQHLAFRAGQAGLVEIWPTIQPRPADAAPAWKPPVERLRGDQPQTRLAGLMAARIAAMVGAEMLTAKGRLVRAGDILVLVRRRSGFVEDLVRALKEQGVAVAGTDRMVLTEQLAVMDLMALGNVLLLPEDDLTLATVLKGPLIGLTEEQLFTLAWNRGRASLWESLRRQAGTDTAFGQAEHYLSDLRDRADRVAPHELFAHVLGPRGGKRAILARLGQEAEDPLDEFITLTMAFERAHPPSLQGFLRWLEQGAVEIKRDLDQGGDDGSGGAVRIMTVHGSKGLQAPVVFLPDTCQMPTRGSKLVWDGAPDTEVVLWPPRADMADPVVRAARDRQKREREREYRRLLYVAMTRAEDRLYVCGWDNRTARPQECWYSLIHAAVAPIAETVTDPFLEQAGETETAAVLRLTCRQEHPTAPATGDTAAAATTPPLPDWAIRPPAPEPAPPRPLAPSAPQGEEPATTSPLGPPGQVARFQRGKLIHRLLQVLPDLPRERRAQTAIRLLQGAGLAQARDYLPIANEVTDILDHPDFAPLFGPNSRAEVPVVGRIGEARAISGQVDRLVVTDTDVLVADYKTNRRPPAADEPVPELYLRQMAAYRLALACIYPHHRIRCALVWTDGPRLAEIPARDLDAALAAMVE